MNKEKAITNILENFDFGRVHTTMKHLKWRWATSKTEDGIPSLGELFLHVERYLNEVYDQSTKKKDDYITGTGGFQYMAQYNKEEQEVDYIEVKFVLTEWEYYE